MTGWLWLIGSIVCEVVGTTFLKLASAGGKHTVGYTVGVGVFYVTSFALLSIAMRYFSLSTVYATWSGLGVSLLAVIGVIAFGDQVNALKIISLLLVIAGIVGMNMSGISH
ncbi:MAG: multidrug efflux SMR transporter [Planctomycetota bacterium]